MRKFFIFLGIFIVVAFLYSITIAQFVFITTFRDLLPGGFYLVVMEVALGILAFAIALRILTKEQYAYNKSYWIIIMLLNPIIGIIAYFIFARDFRLGRLEKERSKLKERFFDQYEETTDPQYDMYSHGDIFRFIHQTTNRSVYENDTYTEVLNNGDQFFPRLMEAMEQAKDYILMEFYILKSDHIGTKILQLMINKAKEGVDCYLIYDHFGSHHHLSRKILKELTNAGVHIGVFDPQKISLLNPNVNFRNHRKATVIDGHTGFVGGMNLGDEYNHQSPKFGFWRDTHLLVKGNGVTSIQNVFTKDWYYITGEVLEKGLDKSKNYLQGLFAVVESGPDYELSKIRDIYFKMISTAKKSIKIVTPYLIIEPEMMLALKLARRSGVEVELLLPGKHDYAVVGYATRSYYETLLREGARIYEYRNRFVHSKILLIDDEIASVGSVNFDPRSFHTNFEVTAIIQNSTVQHLVSSFHEDRAISDEIDLQTWKKRSLMKRLVQGFFNLFSPIF